MNALASLLDLWHERRLRRGIVQKLGPLLGASRAAQGDAVRRQWESDFGLGLLTTVITLLAQRACPNLGSEALGLVQAEGWSELTGIDGTEIGSRILLLTASYDAEFLAGYHAALVFDAALQGVWPATGDEELDERGFPVAPMPEAAGRATQPTLLALWTRLWAREMA